MPSHTDDAEGWDIEDAGREHEHRRNLERLEELAIGGDAIAEAVLRATCAAQAARDDPGRAAFLEEIVKRIDLGRRGSIPSGRA